MKIKKGKKIWFIVSMIFTVLMLFGTVGSLIVNKDFDAYHLIIIFLLISNTGNFIEKNNVCKKIIN